MEEYIRAATLENQIEAQLLHSVLNERDIPHRMRSYHDTAYDGLYQATKGWGYVSAPKARQEEVKAILAELREAAAAADD
jgi:hypothetical protein